MKKFSWSISKYLLLNILPYFIFTWLLLSVILFVQQASRYADIFFSLNIPKSLVWQLTFALIPNVIAFTAPMALLVGVIIGLSKMQGDSELIAIRAAGVGNFQIALPIVLLGLLLSFFAFFINLKGVPIASNIVRSIGSPSCTSWIGYSAGGSTRAISRDHWSQAGEPQKSSTQRKPPFSR